MASGAFAAVRALDVGDGCAQPCKHVARRLHPRLSGDLALHLAGSVIQETLSDEAKAKAVVDRFIADLDAPEKAAT